MERPPIHVILALLYLIGLMAMVAYLLLLAKWKLAVRWWASRSDDLFGIARSRIVRGIPPQGNATN